MHILTRELYLIPYLKVHCKFRQFAQLLIQSHQILECVNEGAFGLSHRFVHLNIEHTSDYF